MKDDIKAHALHLDEARRQLAQVFNDLEVLSSRAKADLGEKSKVYEDICEAARLLSDADDLIDCAQMRLIFADGAL